MLPKTGTSLPKLHISLSDAQLAVIIGTALQTDLGASHRAAKTVMKWTGVSDHTARAWLHGRTSPSGAHLLMLAANCTSVMATVLQLTGHDGIAVSFDLEKMETKLEGILNSVRQLRNDMH